MKKMNTLVRVLCFGLIAALIFAATDNVLKVKYVDGIYSMERFYQLENDTVDLLFLGSSHAFETYNTSVFWDEGGISSYVLAGSMQPMWNTYFYLKEALKTQSPRLIVLDGFGCVFENEYSDYERQIKNCYGMKFSFDKLQAMWISSSLSVINRNDVKFFFPFSNYSSRYRELTKGDFLDHQGETKYENWMGFASNYAQETYETHQMIQKNDQTAKMAPKTEKYYRKLLSLARERQIPVLVVITPYAGIKEKDVAVYSRAEVIAGEYGAAFWNPALDPSSCGLDYQVHAADHDHLNAQGNRIYSEYFFNYMKQYYTFADHKGDETYSSWEKCSTYLKEVDATHRLKNATDLGTLAEELRQGNYDLYLLTGSGCNTECLTGLLNKKTPGAFERGKVYDLKQSESTPAHDKPELSYQDIYLKYHDDLVRSNRDEINTTYTADANSAMIIVYDTIIDGVCDVITLNGSDETVVAHP